MKTLGSVVVALVAGIGIGAVAVSALGSAGDGAPDVEAAQVSDADVEAPDKKPCPPCPAAVPCPRSVKPEVRPRSQSSPHKASPEPVVGGDRAARWPADVPKQLTPEFVRDVLRRARTDCPDLPPIAVDCRGFPCALVMRTTRGNEISAFDLSRLCSTLSELGPTSAKGQSTSDNEGTVWVHTQDQVGSHDMFSKRNEPLRAAIAKSGQVEKLYCEQEGDAKSCAEWGATLARQDLDEAMKVSAAACEDGAGYGCSVIAMLGTDPVDNFTRACELGDAKGCYGIVATLCSDEGTGCGNALKHARKLREVLEDGKRSNWSKQRALQTEGKVLCASGDPKAGLALLEAGCLDQDGNPRKWCNPQEMCDKPRFNAPRLR